MARLRVLPPEGNARESWRQRSSFVLGEYLGDHEATLDAFGLERPVPQGKVPAFLSDHSRRRRAEGLTVHTEGMVGVSMPNGSVSAFAALPELRLLTDSAQRIAGELDCDPGRVVAFLLTGLAFDLPWIEIETRLEDLGPSFVIHVGSADVTAEDVRQAYVAAVRAVLGAESTHTLPAHIYPLVRAEAEGRLAGLKWADRWRGWKQYAHEWGITEYESVESYRNYVGRLKKKHAWIGRELETADWEREFRQQEEEGSA